MTTSKLGQAGRDRHHVEQIARGGFFNMAGAVVSALAVFAFTVVVTRSTTQGQAGILFAVTSAFIIAYSTTRLGVPTGLVYFIAGYRADNAQSRLRPVYTQALVVVSLVGTALSVAGIVAAPTLARALTGSDDASTVWLVRLLSAGVTVAAIADVAVGATRGFGVMRPLVVIERVGRPLGQLLLALLVVALISTPTALPLGAAWLMPFLPAAVLALLWARRLLHGAERRAGLQPPPFRAALREVSAFWRFTAPRSVSSVAQIGLQRADIVLVGVLRSPEEAAIYAAATRFLVLGQLAGAVVSTTIQPKIAVLVRRGSWHHARTVYRTATMWLILLAWPLYLTFAVFAPQLLQVFGDGYNAGWPVIVLLSLTMLIATSCGAVDTVLVMAGKSSWTMMNALLALLVNVTLNLLLIPSYGILGAAVSWSAAILVSNLLPLVQLKRTFALHPFGRAMAGATVLSGVLFGLVPGSFVALGVPLWAALVALLGCVTAYALALWRFRAAFELSALAAIRRGRAASTRAGQR